MQIMQGKIGIITVTYNSEHVLEEFFRSLAAQQHQNFMLYLIDNCSRDRTLEMARQVTNIPLTIIANADNLGVAEGNNQGIRAALDDGCEALLLLNNDTAFKPDFLGTLYAGLQEHDADMCTCKMYHYEHPGTLWCAGGSFQPLLGYRIVHRGTDLPDGEDFNKPLRITYTPTCCLLAYRRVFDRIGLMDQRYFVYYDDVDFLYRCLRHGLSLWYIPTARLWHKTGSLTENQAGASDFTVRYCTRNRIYFLRKSLSFWQAHLWYLIYRTYFAADFLLRRSPRALWKLRENSAREGWNLLRKT
jgi:GT2 family glycosyltransferase